jgi:hypothetical protein
MSMMITGILFVLGILLASLGILTTALSVDPRVNAFLFFIGLFLFGWALLSLGLHPEVSESSRTVAFFFAALLVTVLFGYGIKIVTTVG